MPEMAVCNPAEVPWWRRWTSAPAGLARVHRRRAEFVAGLLLILGPVGSLATWIRVSVDPSYLSTALGVQLGLLTFVPLYLLARSRWHTVAAWVSCFAAMGVAVGASIASGEVGLLIAYSAMPVMLGGIVLSLRGTLLMASLMLVCVMGRGMLLPATDWVRFSASGVPFVVLVTTLVVLGILQRDGLERDRRAELEESHDRYREIFDRTFHAWVVVVDGRVVELRGELARLFGPSAESAEGKTVPEVFHPVDPRIEQLVHDGTVQTMERLGPNASTVEWVAGNVFYQGKSARLLAARDVTERRRLERAIADAERTLALGHVAAGVGHEINNPLTFILGNVALLEERAEELKALGVGIGAELADIREGGERIKVIVGDLTALGSPPIAVEDVVDLKHVVAVAARMTRRQLAGTCRLVTECSDAPLVLGNSAKLTQVVMNLMLHAASESPSHREPERCVTVRTRSAPGGRVLLEVIDDGPGIDPQVLPHLFEPFAAVESGLRLSLAVCHSIVTLHQGTLSVRSRPGETCIEVSLRAAAPAAAEARPAATPTGLKVLVIDDEPIIAKVLVRAFRNCQVEIATDGREGLQRALAQRYDAIFCDMMLPELSGAQIYEGLRAAGRAHRCFILMTGGAFTAEARDFIKRFEGPIVEKPMTRDHLWAAVARVARTTATTV